MCSIVGIGFQRKHTIHNPYLVDGLITRLLLNGMTRGRTSTGICCTSNKKISVVKNNIPADKFVYTRAYTDFLEKTRTTGDNRLISVLGHCRQKTKGTELDPKNNHPINVEDVVGIHNGIIVNDDATFEKFKNNINRRGRVDSEIIFALIAHFSRASNSICKGIIKACKELLGSYACATVHRYQPHILWLFRSSSPCSIWHFKKEGLIMFASLPEFIHKAIAPYALSVPVEIELCQKEGIGIDLESNKYQRFSLD